MTAPRATARLTRRFVAYGVRIGLCMDAPSVLEVLESEAFRAQCPPGWARDDADSDHGILWYAVTADASPGNRRTYSLHFGTERVAAPQNLAGVLRAFVAHAELVVAERAPAHLFVHAGVVAWHGRAVLIPGRSGAGKTSLVRACLAAGATYYSDEYAIFDRAGRVHPYTRPLAIRGGPGETVQHVSAETLGARVGGDALSVGLVLVTAYRPGARWRPRRLTPARALVALLGHTVAAQGSPAHSMPILRQVVTGARAFAGRRGEAALTVADIAARIGAGTSGTAVS